VTPSLSQKTVMQVIKTGRFVKNSPSFRPSMRGGLFATTPAAPTPDIQYEGYHYDRPKGNKLTYHSD